MNDSKSEVMVFERAEVQVHYLTLQHPTGRDLM